MVLLGHSLHGMGFLHSQIIQKVCMLRVGWGWWDNQKRTQSYRGRSNNPQSIHEFPPSIPTQDFEGANPPPPPWSSIKGEGMGGTPPFGPKMKMSAAVGKCWQPIHTVYDLLGRIGTILT